MGFFIQTDSLIVLDIYNKIPDKNFSLQEFKEKAKVNIPFVINGAKMLIQYIPTNARIIYGQNHFEKIAEQNLPLA